MKKIGIRLNERGYEVIVAFNEIESLGRFVRALDIGTDALIITNPIVKRLFYKRLRGSFITRGFNVKLEVVPDSERAKSEKYYSRILKSISNFDNSRRRIFIVTLGGGVIGDLGGFVASVYRRGIPYIQVPTTLMAQVDSAIGGKVAIDLKVGKNLVGAFYQPRLVFSDVSLLKTLHKDDILSGLSEVIKYGIIKSPRLFSFVEENYTKILKRDKKALLYVVYLCSLIKAKVVEKDEYDNKGLRVILNLGHTIGHAIETAAHYGKLYTHGEAVAIGIVSAALISKKMHLLDEKVYLRIKRLITKIGLPTIIKGINIGDIISFQEHDKKFIHGKNRFVLPIKIGKVVVREGIPERLIERSLSSLYGSKK